MKHLLRTISHIFTRVRTVRIDLPPITAKHARKSSATDGPWDHVPDDIRRDEDFMRLFEKCREQTMTSPERMYALYQATRYIVQNHIQGDVVECGVWRGGSSMLAALALQSFGDNRRDFYLYDTFAGMPAPTAEDGKRAESKWQAKSARGELNTWCHSTKEDVQNNMRKTGYPASRVTLVQGMVENTIPSTAPETIALLRLDTDWYASTKHELEHLFPRLQHGGILIIDDYGTWEGSRKAVDEYLAKNGRGMFLSRIDSTGVILIKH